MSTLLTRLTLFASSAVLLACSSEPPVGPNTSRSTHYLAERLGNSGVPTLIWGGYRLDSAMLIPYALGRPFDQRLVNDRTGRGGTGGNTRDTAVSRGQFIDMRIISGSRDSTVVDVEMQDTVVIVTRPHPDPSRVRVDTGWFLGDRLYLPTIIDYMVKLPFTVEGLERCPPMPDQYHFLPCPYRTELVYRLER